MTRREVAGSRLPKPLPAGNPDTGFEADADVLSRRRDAARRHAATVQIPLLRTFGFLVLCVIDGIYGVRSGAALPWSLWALNLSFAAAAWAAVHALRNNDARLSTLGMLLFHLDLVVWLVNVYYLETQQGQFYFAYFLLARVVDQIGFGFRRALYFLHVVVAAYLAYALVVEGVDPLRAEASDRLGVAATMYLVGLYFSAVGLVTERLRRRARRAMSAARDLVAALERKNETLQRQARELEEARASAEQASIAKSQFLAVTSHEIRTPMNGILGAMELLIGTSLSEEQTRYVRIAHRSGTALLGLIDDVLDLSRIEASRLELRLESIELPALLSEAVELIRIGARDKGILVHVELAPGLPRWVRGDALRLRQVLVNLLSNAVKFTEGGEVVLQAARVHGDERALRLSVRDTGIGIPPGQLAAIFSAFTQVDSSSTRRHGGSGLGLAIVHEIVTLMGGTVAVESRPGQGSTFTVELPLEEAAEPEGWASEPAPDRPGTAIRVLLAEDDAVNQLVVAGMLERMGCTVETVADGAAALDASSLGVHDIVFMDCHMPVMDGWEAARQIRAAETSTGRRRVAIVALTADALPSERERCLAAGMDDFLTKPVSSAQLADTIAAWTGRVTTNPATQW
jgi:signal transduction histidine kinase/ActR/RegA family two-component response regulator